MGVDEKGGDPVEVPGRPEPEKQAVRQTDGPITETDEVWQRPLIAAGDFDWVLDPSLSVATLRASRLRDPAVGISDQEIDILRSFPGTNPLDPAVRDAIGEIKFAIPGAEIINVRGSGWPKLHRKTETFSRSSKTASRKKNAPAKKRRK